ncbi:MAG: alpha/beta hydrolase [Bacteroidia bacterium]|nr:alpha/beta hydrolase [Bacteroidia bacterium]
MKSVFRLFQGLILLAALLAGNGCKNPPPQKEEVSEPAPCQPQSGDFTLNQFRFPVEIQVPDSPQRGNLLILPGWNFSRNDWCENSSLCTEALQRGYALIRPEMGKSTYQSQNYPETRPDWRTFPTGTWLWDTLIPGLQDSLCLLKPEQNNFVMGLSTGARGAVMTAYKLPGLFKGCAALSGDYDQRLLPGDNLMRGFYGELEQFPDRWSGGDNPVRQVKKFKTPLYLGHGGLDKVVPQNQTQVYNDSLHAAQPNLQIRLNLPDSAQHDYNYWNSEVKPVLDFFEAQK